jgi:hypothetical protein
VQGPAVLLAFARDGLQRAPSMSSRREGTRSSGSSRFALLLAHLAACSSFCTSSWARRLAASLRFQCDAQQQLAARLASPGSVVCGQRRGARSSSGVEEQSSRTKVRSQRPVYASHLLLVQKRGSAVCERIEVHQSHIPSHPHFALD